MKNNIKGQPKVLVLGAGIAGCAASQALQRDRKEYLLIEKHVAPGGLTRSISVGDAHFDYTGHFLHLTTCKTPSAIPFAHQRDEEWALIYRRAAVYIDGIIVPAPFQYNLYYLPAEIRKECIEGFRKRRVTKDIKSLREYLLSGFGEGICKHFLFPYNEKLMARPLKELSISAINRFFPLPDPERIETGYSQEGANLETGYNSRFWYPKQEGIGLLARGLASGIESIQTNCNIESIDIRAKRVKTSMGDIDYSVIFSSLPLKALSSITNNKALRELSLSLRHTKVFCLNLLLKRPVPELLNGLQWIYIPDKKIPFYRLGIYTNISPYINPKGTTAYYIEVAFLNDQDTPSPDKLVSDILHSLEILGWGRHSECSVISANWIECAYIHFDHYRNAALAKIFNILRSHDIYPIGRYGLWDYISMEDAILSGIKAVSQ